MPIKVPFSQRLLGFAAADCGFATSAVVAAKPTMPVVPRPAAAAKLSAWDFLVKIIARTVRSKSALREKR